MATSEPARPASVVREVYAGHAVAVTSTGVVTVDGVALPLELTVGDDGSVRCPGLPGYAAGSVIELVRRFIDTYPPEGPAVGGGPRDLSRVDDEGDMGGTGHTTHADG
jgi:hypothetical protein